jgi:hypothetical protein
MSFLSFALSRRFVVIVLGAGAFIIGTCLSTSAGSKIHRSSSGAFYNFQTIDDPAEDALNTQVTGINHNDNIVGVYYGTPAPTYKSFRATQNSSGGWDFFRELGSYSDVYLSGINDRSNMDVGFSPPWSAGACSGLTSSICGVVHDPNNPDGNETYQIADPSEGGGGANCAQTYLYGTSDARIQVGYYNTSANGGIGCKSQAFEEYCGPSTGSGYQCTPQFVDFHPPGAYSSMAYGINNKGDVVGAMTTSPGGSLVGWEYSEFHYSTIQVSSFPTQARGIDWGDKVVGSYTDSSNVTRGFLMHGSDWYYPINDGQSTVVSDIDDSWNIVGWSQLSVNGPLSGFYGTCKPNCPSLGVRGGTKVFHTSKTKGGL